MIDFDVLNKRLVDTIANESDEELNNFFDKLRREESISLLGVGRYSNLSPLIDSFELNEDISIQLKYSGNNHDTNNSGFKYGKVA